METIFTLTGWVRKVIDNEHAKTLEEIRYDAVGNIGKETLMDMAKGYLDYWNKSYHIENKRKKFKIVAVCTVYSNKVANNGFITRDETIFTKLIKSELLLPSEKTTKRKND